MVAFARSGTIEEIIGCAVLACTGAAAETCAALLSPHAGLRGGCAPGARAQDAECLAW